MSTKDQFRVETWWYNLDLNDKLRLKSQGSGPLPADLHAAITKAGGMLVTTFAYGPDVFTLPDEDWAWIKAL